jgi:hypothetical protein
MPWGSEQETESTYRPWGHNPHLDDWDKSSEAWLDYWHQHHDEEAEEDDGETVRIKKHRRKAKRS